MLPLKEMVTQAEHAAPYPGLPLADHNASNYKRVQSLIDAVA